MISCDMALKEAFERYGTTDIFNKLVQGRPYKALNPWKITEAGLATVRLLPFMSTVGGRANKARDGRVNPASQ